LRLRRDDVARPRPNFQKTTFSDDCRHPEALAVSQKEKMDFLKQVRRWDRMTADIQDIEIENLILQDLEKQIMPFDEWSQRREG
jgi:hypothetical protein